MKFIITHFTSNKLGRRFPGRLVPVFLLFVVAFTSCNKFLDVRPEGELPENQLLKDEGGFEAALYGVYGTMNSASLYGANLTNSTTELLAQYFTVGGNQTVMELLKYNYRYSAVESTFEDIWSNQYKAISYANNVLKNLQNFSPQTLEFYDVYKGEALGIRAFLHFDLLRLFGENIQLNASAPGIPYSTEFSLTAAEFISLSAVYDKIIDDLKTAEELLSKDEQRMTFPKTNPSTPFLRDRETHFNLYSVQATLARVYLTKGDLANAATYAEKIIGSGKFALLEKTEIANGIFRGMLYPKEAIFGLYSNRFYESMRDRFSLQTTFASYDNRPNISAIYNTVQGGHDYRWDGFFRQPVLQTDKLRFVKLVDPYQERDQEYLRNPSYIKGINLIRLPEMYYIAAEALLASNPDKARDYFDVVLKSRGLIALKDRSPSVPLSIELINEERYKELIGEGQSFFNMKRQNLNIVNTSMQTIPATKEIYVPPIPQIEIDYRN